jgi:putative ABC transport system permease protein
MLKNYLIITLRNILRHKLFFFINIFGLATSMCICLIALMAIKDQLNYDNFHPQADRTYRITTEIENPDGNHFQLASSPLPLTTTILKEYALAEHAVRLYPALKGKASNRGKELDLKGAFTDPAFFSVFGFTLEKGDVKTALSAPNSIILSKETAIKFFGSNEPIGQVISLKEQGDFLVTGVLADAPGKSHITFEAFASMASVPVLEKSGKLTEKLTQWNSVMEGYTYITLKETASKRKLTEALNQISAHLTELDKSNNGSTINFEAQALTSITPGKDLYNDIGKGYTRKMVAGVISISLIILLSACFNYTNLSIARSLTRAKEVGIRKVAGAFRYQIFMQFILEAIVISLLSLGVACLLLMVIIDYTPFGPETPPDTYMFLYFLVFSLFAGLMAGTLPAWVLSSFQPVRALKNLTAINLFGSINVRKSLIVSQFVLSLVATVFLMVTYRQFNYMIHADYGFSAKDILTIPLQGTSYPLLSSELSKINGVERISAISTNLGRDVTGTMELKVQPSSNPVQVGYYAVDANFIATMRLKLLAGHTFSATASSAEKHIIINERTLAALGIKTPVEAIDRVLWMNDSSQVRIAGVLKDFHYQPLSNPIGTMALYYNPEAVDYLNVKVTHIHSSLLIQQLEQAWKKINPSQPFTYSWFEKDLNERRSAWDLISTLGFLAFLAITIAYLGLLGMVTFTAETRQKEISIRKVMGASVWDLVVLLSKSFVILLLVAGLIALPLGYLGGTVFLYNFAYRVAIGADILVISFVGLLAIGLLAISTQTYRVAAANPADILRNE